MADAISKLRALRRKGITTMVDPTLWGLGRYIPRIQRIAEQVDLNIVVAAGLYVYEELPQQYAYRGPGLLFDAPEPMITDFTRDIVDGIGTSGVKAALLKCCVDVAGLTAGIDRIARAVARTHLAPVRRSRYTPAASRRRADLPDSRISMIDRSRTRTRQPGASVSAAWRCQPRRRRAAMRGATPPSRSRPGTRRRKTASDCSS